MAEQISAKRVTYLAEFSTIIYRELDGKSLLDYALSYFVHWVTVIEKSTIVARIEFNLTEKGLLFQTLVVPKIALDKTIYNESLTIGK